MSKKPASLPEPGRAVMIPKGRKIQARATPSALPLPQTKEPESEISAIERTRSCEKCGKPGRLVSNQYGLHAYCVCGNDWPISSTPLRPNVPLSPMRGITKITSVEPDWDIAFREIGDTPNDKIGPKPRR